MVWLCGRVFWRSAIMLPPVVLCCSWSLEIAAVVCVQSLGNLLGAGAVLGVAWLGPACAFAWLLLATVGANAACH